MFMKEGKNLALDVRSNLPWAQGTHTVRVGASIARPKKSEGSDSRLRFWPRIGKWTSQLRFVRGPIRTPIRESDPESDPSDRRYGNLYYDESVQNKCP